jgi:uncharacterized protein (DUF58 family)
MTVSGFAGWLNIRGVEASVHFPDEIYDGRDTMITVRLRNRKKLLPSFLLGARIFDAAVTFHLVEPGREEVQALTIRFRGRGRRLLGWVQISSVFPINFFVRTRGLSQGTAFTVFPAPVPCSRTGDDEGSDSRGESRSSRTGYGGDLLRIREYSGYEPMKLIHWRHSARQDELKVKVLAASVEPPLVLDVRTLPGKSVEECVSCGAFLINRTMRTGRPVGLKLGGVLIAPDTTRMHRLRMLSELADYGKG